MSAVATATVRAEHSYDNERNSAKCGMAEEETGYGERVVTEGEMLQANECKCIEIQIIILSRRIVCLIAYAEIQSTVALVWVKGLKGRIRGLLFSLVRTSVYPLSSTIYYLSFAVASLPFIVLLIVLSSRCLIARCLFRVSRLSLLSNVGLLFP